MWKLFAFHWKSVCNSYGRDLTARFIDKILGKMTYVQILTEGFYNFKNTVSSISKHKNNL